jgi:RIO kinase 1
MPLTASEQDIVDAARQVDAARLLAVQPFIDEGLVTAVSGLVKTGKEASVLRCKAHPSLRARYVALKAYHGRRFRNFRADGVYTSGRALERNPGMARIARGIRRGRKAGQELRESLWTGHEFQTLHVLHAAGSAAPEPFAATGNAILMEYIGDGQAAAPQLASAHLDREEAEAVFGALLAEVELWLGLNVVHGDLSAYNVLYWKGRPRPIDFPQAVDPRFNPNAPALLERDLVNVQRHLSRFGLRADPQRLAAGLWRRFTLGQL